MFNVLIILSLISYTFEPSYTLYKFKMVFFKQDLLMLTCITIAVWIMPPSASTNVDVSRHACWEILHFCGFKNFINEKTSAEIEDTNYIAKINDLTNDALADDVVYHDALADDFTDYVVGDVNHINDNDIQAFRGYIKTFVNYTNENLFVDNILENIPASKSLSDINIIRGRTAMNLSRIYQKFYDGHKLNNWFKYHNKNPVTYFCDTYLKEENREFFKDLTEGIKKNTT
ncbi:uncharacterized protein LOC100302381 [Acyrthosiphon pisum]|uniref:Uncharacterized protein n=1 Tax=Acyrthosiphon pisum TaxID=7029 RepID=C4WXS3_ACYPI|nr:uncharacterized protein LOC100302381 [Acyrthosiphon pisum]BAH72693.1 hypothetical protein [Acyrthosiphon pisum]|eukprot:NP_001156441.1 uncharacterized protein LOC100302381 [Acyrthosiphon pisum]